MKQSKLESLIEVLINVSMGFVVAILIGEFIIIPLYAPDWSHRDNFIVTSIYTTAAIVRGFIVRRFFNAELHKQAVLLARWISEE